MKRLLDPAAGSLSNKHQPRGSRSDRGFSKTVIQWQKKHGRNNLPWQQSKDPYRVWLSEIMLQQTQVATVIPYYQRFLSSFPDVSSCAQASNEQIMAHWSGMGYYTRARNLHACAKKIMDQYGGVFPSQPELLEALPGIGRSTAAAIAAFSYGARAAILDGNVKRVFTRVFGIDGYPSSKQVEDELWLLAASLMPEANKDAIQSYTQGLMDLGATLCTRTKPRCNVCPLEKRCVALSSGRTDELPARKPKKSTPAKQIIMMVLVDKLGSVLLEKRPPVGIWGGLYSLPELTYEDGQTAKQLQKKIMKAAQPFADVDIVLPLEQVTHGFSHFTLTIHPFQCELKHKGYVVSEDNHVWYPLNRYHEAPLPAPIKKLLGQVDSER